MVHQKSGSGREESICYGIMVTIKAQMAGGAARAKQQRELAATAYAATAKKCAHCGQPIPLPPCGNFTSARRKKYCNIKCATASTGKMPRRRRGPLPKCKICRRTDTGPLIRRRCYECREHLLRKLDVTGLRTKGDLFANRKNWQSARSTIQRRARETYRTSGLPMICRACGYNRHVEIAHQRAVSEFSDTSTINEINAIDNLMALCPNHHWEQEHGLLVVAVAGFEPTISTV